MPASRARIWRSRAGNLSKALFSLDGHALARTRDGGIELCDGAGEACRTLAAITPSWIAFATDSRRLGFGNDDGSGWFDVASGERHVVGGALVGAAWSPDGRLLALGESHRRLIVVDAETGESRTIEDRSLAFDVAWSRDGRRLAWRDDQGTVGVAELATGRRWELAGEPPVNGMSFTPALVFSADGERLFGGVPGGGLATWDLATGATTLRAAWHELPIIAIALSPDGKTLATASNDRTVRLLDLDTGAATALTGHRAEVWQLAFSPDGKRLASGARDATVRLWDLATGDVHVLRGHDKEIRSVAFDPTGARLISASEDRVIAWDLAHVPPPLADAAAVRAALEAETTVVLGADDRPVTP
jgi:WD40 repeat protein